MRVCFVNHLNFVMPKRLADGLPKFIMRNAFRDLEKNLKKEACPKKAEWMSSYLRNQFQCLGIASPERKAVEKEFRKQHCIRSEEELLAWVKHLWKQPYREYQYIALSELQKYRKLITSLGVTVVEECIVDKSWWDTVDMLAANVLCLYYVDKLSDLETVLPKWIESDNMWLNRTAILVHLQHKDKIRLDLLQASIVPHLESDEFFLQKAIGWSLRELSKRNPSWVRQFVKSHNLKPLSLREGLKYLNK